MANSPYPGAIIGFPSSYGTRPKPPPNGNGAMVVPLVFPFSTLPSQQSYTVLLQGIFPLGLTNIQTIFIDNGASPTITTVTFPVGGEAIVAEPFTRGFYSVSTSSLAMNVTNIALTSFNVGISVYNYIVPPIVMNATGLALGSSDVVEPTRVGNLIANGAINAGSITPVAFSGFVGFPYYYITNISINFSSIANASALQTGVVLYDGSSSGLTVLKIFWDGEVCSTTNGIVTTLCNLNGVAMGGVSELYVKCTAATTLFGVIALNVYGGTTSAQF